MFVYGNEAVIPTKVGIPSTRCELTIEEQNDTEMSYSVDTIDELREQAAV